MHDTTSGDDLRLIDDREVSRLTGISRHRIQTLRFRGGGPIFVKVGRSVRYRIVDIKRWLDDNTQRTTSEGGNSDA